MRQICRRDPLAAVADGEAREPVVARPTDLDGPTCGRMPQRVVEEIRRDPSERVLVAEDRDAWRTGCGERDSLLFDAFAELGRRVLQELSEVDLVSAQLGPAVLDPAEREQLVDHPVEPARLLLRSRYVAGGAAVTLKSLEVAAQEEQRRAQVVCDRRDEKAAFLIGPGVPLGRLEQPTVHRRQRRSDLGHLADTRLGRLSVSCAAGDRLDVLVQATERTDDPTADEE